MSSDSTKQPKKGLVIQPLKQPFDLQTEKLGVVKVGHLTMKALIKISPDLDPKSEVSDQDLIMAVFLAVATHPPETDGVQPCPLTADEVAQVTEQDIRDFAKRFLEAENWEASSEADPVASLAEKIRSQIRQIGESTKKTMDQFQGILSNDTKRLFMMNTALSERLKEVSGLAKINQFIKDREQFESLTAASQLLKEREEYLKVGATADLLKNLPGASATGAFAPLPKLELPKIEIPQPVDLPINRAAKAMTELNQKADSLKETADAMASAIGIMNEAIASALLDFKAKQQRDDKSQRISLNIAAGSLVASVIVGLVSLWFSWGSYELAKASDTSSSEQRIGTENAMAEQTKLLRDLLLTQQEQKKLLADSQSSVAARGPNTAVQGALRDKAMPRH
ncbi:hypothetical protein [Ideonella paludis]|uniref:Uncharacterized protein n=1 Tax=Ideonella paludis TaxID=1233411 RepID=A0ABS5DSP0_9BURK|nr:hypothetical protein [Ideonella paludis]MBQ0934165.1 hypothetical protein [Ideonella paludis]